METWSGKTGLGVANKLGNGHSGQSVVTPMSGYTKKEVSLPIPYQPQPARPLSMLATQGKEVSPSHSISGGGEPILNKAITAITKLIISTGGGSGFGVLQRGQKAV